MENSSSIRQKLSTLYKQKQEFDALDEVDIMNLILVNQESNKQLVNKVISGIIDAGSRYGFFENKDKYLNPDDIDSPQFKNIVVDIFRNFNDEIKKERDRIFKLLLEKRLLQRGGLKIWLEKYEQDLELLEMQFDELIAKTNINNFELSSKERLSKISRDYEGFNFMLEHTKKKIDHISYKISLLEKYDENGDIKLKVAKDLSKIEELGARIEKGDYIEGFLDSENIEYLDKSVNFILIFYKNDELIIKYKNYLKSKFEGLNLNYPIENHIIYINNLNTEIFNSTISEFINDIFSLDEYYLNQALQTTKDIEQIKTINPQIYQNFIDTLSQKIENKKIFSDLISNTLLSQSKYTKLHELLSSVYDTLGANNKYEKTKEYRAFMDKLHYLCTWENTSSTKRSSYGTGSGSSQNVARTIFMNIENILKEGDIRDLELLFNAKNLGELITFNRDADLEAKISRVYDQLKNIDLIDFSQFLIELRDAITSKNNRGKNHRSDENYGKEFHKLMERYAIDIGESYEDLKNLINNI